MAEIRAALAAGASPAAAITAAATEPPLSGVVAGVRLGQPLSDVARTVDTGDAAIDLLVRALGVAERVGAGGLDAVDQALGAVREEADLLRLLRSRSAQARGTAVLLGALPLAAWLLFAIADPGILAYYANPLGWATGGAAVLLAGGAQLWSKRIVARAGRAAAAADPLHPPAPSWRWPRGIAVCLPAAAVLAVGAGVDMALLGAGALLVLAARPARVGRTAAAGGGGSTEAVELLAIALRAGLNPPAALAVAAELAPPAARPALSVASRRLRGGWDAAEALEGTGLEALGAVLDASLRWGAPAGPALARLAADLRAERRSRAEEAAERAQLHLVFPTTLLTLPAFLLGVVPPLLWTAFAGAPALQPLP